MDAEQYKQWLAAGRESLEGLAAQIKEERHKEIVYWAEWEWFLWGYLSQFGMECRGFSFRQKLDEWLLCLRVDGEGGAQVAFMSSSTTTGCVRKMCNALRTGEVRWYEDRYA